jgi:hypothetical protein
MRVPTPDMDSSSILPPMAEMFFFTIHADATTGHLRHLIGGGKARLHDELPHLLVVMASLTAMPRSFALARMRARLRPAPSSPTSITMLPLW